MNAMPSAKLRILLLVSWALVAFLARAPLSAVRSPAVQAPSIQEPTVETAPAFPPAAPESTGLSTEGLERLAAKVAVYQEHDLFVGAELLVIKDRKTVLHRVYGDRDREDGIPMPKDTIFNIRSMTKPLTGAAIQMLIDDGKLRLEQRVAEILPAFDNEDSRQITVEQLLTHRSGLPLTVVAGVRQYDDLQEIAAKAGTRGPQFPPGAKFWYSDAGTDVLGAIVEKISGETLDRFWQRRLLEPLGMHDSLVPLDAEDPRFERIASLYIGQPGNWFRYWMPSRGPFYPFAWGSQTMYSTPADYARFLAMWMDDGRVGDRRVLSEAAVERTLTPVSRTRSMGSDEPAPTGFPGLEFHYGQMAGVWIDPEAGKEAPPRVVGHTGSDGTAAWAFPEEDLIVLLFTQSRGGIAVLNLERWIDRLLVDPDWTPEPTATELDEEIVGEYLADFGSLRDTTIEILLLDGRPAIDLRRGRVIELLDPDEQGRWAFNFDPRSAVSFTRNAEGAIDALHFHQGPWSFEAPRDGVPIVVELEPETLQRYLGTYRIEAMDADVEVVVHRGRLALDVSALPVETPVDHFELLPPDGQGRWVYRVNDQYHVVFDQDDDGTIEGLRIYENGALDASAERVP